MPDNPEMQRMQQDAVRRAMEMQARARAGPEVHVPESRQRMQQGDPRRRTANGVQQPNHGQQSNRSPQPRTANQAQGRGTVPQPPQRPPSPPQEQHPPPMPAKPDGENVFSSAGEILDLLLQDSERTLILALILLLSSEKADSALIFALMYLAM